LADAHADYSRLAEVVAGLGLHEHLCVVYDTQEEQFAAALPFFKAGLAWREKCLFFADEKTAGALLDALRKVGTDVDEYLRRGALTITHKRETDLQQGRFDPDWWVGFLNQAIAEVGAAKYSALRILGDMDWALQRSDSREKLFEYESRINHFVREHDARVVCQYNLNRNSPELILGIIRTHPLVVYGGMVCKNPYYVPPEEFLKPNQAALEVERLLRASTRSVQLERSKRAFQLLTVANRAPESMRYPYLSSFDLRPPLYPFKDIPGFLRTSEYKFVQLPVSRIQEQLSHPVNSLALRCGYSLRADVHRGLNIGMPKEFL
jgi:hypothetical protein